MPTLLALHGHTLSGDFMRRELAHLENLGVDLVCPDGPLACPGDVVDRLYTVWAAPRQPPPYRAWWDASDDGRTYRGWESTLEVVTPLLERGSVGIIGFSQGAILATALAALSQHGKLPAISYVVLIAGRTPRADAITPFLVDPIRTPSLHIWGERDHLVGDTSRELVDRFAPATRTVFTWPGGHVIPHDGPAARAIEQHITRDAGRTRPSRE